MKFESFPGGNKTEANGSDLGNLESDKKEIEDINNESKEKSKETNEKEEMTAEEKEFKEKLEKGELSNEEVSRLNIEELAHYADIREEKGKKLFDEDDENIKSKKSQFKRFFFKIAVGLGLLASTTNTFAAGFSKNNERVDKDPKKTELAPTINEDQSEGLDNNTYFIDDNDLEGSEGGPDNFFDKLNDTIKESPDLFDGLSPEDLEGLSSTQKIEKVVESNLFFFFENIEELKTIPDLDFNKIINKIAEDDPSYIVYGSQSLEGIDGLDLPAVLSAVALEDPDIFYDNISQFANVESLDINGLLSEMIDANPDYFFKNIQQLNSIDGLDINSVLVSAAEDNPGVIFKNIQIFKSIDGLDLSNLISQVSEENSYSFLNNVQNLQGIDGLDLSELISQAATKDSKAFLNNVQSFKNIDGLELGDLISQLTPENSATFFANVQNFQDIDGLDLPDLISKIALEDSGSFLYNIKNIQSIDGLDLGDLVSQTVAKNPNIFLYNINDFKNIDGLDLPDVISQAVSIDPSSFLAHIQNFQDISGLDLPDVISQAVSIDPSSFLTHIQNFQDIDGLDLPDLVSSSFEPVHNIIMDENSSSMDKIQAENALKMGSLSMVNEMNNLHERPAAERFQSIDNFDSKELYLLITYGQDEIYTSSFNGCFDRMVGKMAQEGASGQDLTEQIDQGEIRTFVKECTWFNRLDDFLDTMDRNDANELLGGIVRNIEATDSKVDQAITVAEIFGKIDNPETVDILKGEIKSEVERVNNSKEVEQSDKNMYEILASIFANENDIEDDWFKNIQDKYQIEKTSGIEVGELYDDNGVCTQKYNFYESGDKDGINSFNNFLNHYEADSDWSVDKSHEGFVVISAEKDGHRIEIYANEPRLDNEHKTSSQEMDKFLEEKGADIKLYSYRGHSFGISLNGAEGAKIINLGSCGGFNNVSNVLDLSPEAHVISTKGTGTMYVNDPLFKDLNDKILDGENVDWESFWAQEETKLGANKNFDNYISPDKNLSMIFMKAYNKTLDSN